jgi:hypothetical protein
MGGDYGRFAGVTGAGKFDDYVLPFQLEASGARGRLIRLGPVSMRSWAGMTTRNGYCCFSGRR